MAVKSSAERVKRRRLDPDDRRVAILATALEMLATAPPEQISVDQIARRAGASPALVHHYFGSKDALVEAALSAAADELVEQLVVQPGHPAAEELVAGLGRYLDYISAHPVSWSSLLRASGSHSSAAAIAERVDQRAIAFSLDALLPGSEPPAALVVALRGWLALIKDVCWRWINEQALGREEVEALLTIAYVGVLQSAVAADPACQPALDAFEGRNPSDQ